MSAVLFTKVDRDKAYAYFLRVSRIPTALPFILLKHLQRSESQSLRQRERRSPDPRCEKGTGTGANRAFDQDHMASWHMDILYAHDVPVHVGCGMWVVVWLIRDSG